MITNQYSRNVAIRLVVGVETSTLGVGVTLVFSELDVTFELVLSV